MLLPNPAALIRSAVAFACGAETRSAFQDLAEHLPHTVLFGPPLNVNMIGWRQRFLVPGGQLLVEPIAPHGFLRRVSVQYETAEGNRPTLLAMADFRCTIHTARRLHYDTHGKPAWIEQLDSALNPSGQREPLNPPVPARHDPGGIPVALVDTGVNYLLPEINRRLARNAAGELLGYDYWELDRRPFDVHPIRSAFFPRRHGTQTASLLLAEAPMTRLLPYRYPRPDMARMKTLIEDAAAHGVRLVNLSMASNSRTDWLAFYLVAKRHPKMLFIAAAGNKSRNIDQVPMYPASFALENMITVTSATADGHLAAGVNWGPHTVDLMVQAERNRVTGFNGQPRLVSGSSYAAARVTALAICLLAAHATWQAPELKTAIFQRARPPQEAGYVAQGFLPNPVLTDRGACKAQRPSSGL